MSNPNIKYGRVSALAVIDLAKELYERGLVSQTVLAQIQPTLPQWVTAHFNGENLSSLASEYLSELCLIELWQQAENASADPLLGLEIGQTITPSTHGVLANWTRHGTTLREAFETFASHIALLNQSEHWQLSYHGDDQSLVEIRFHFDAGKPYPAIAWQRSLVVIPTWGAYFSGSHTELKKVELSLPKPNAAIEQRWQEAFGCPILFEQAQCSIWLNAEELNKPSQFSDPFVKHLVSEKAKTLMPYSALSIDKQVLTVIEQDPFTYNQLDAVAQFLNMSRSTLYRKLKENGKNFSELLEQHRYKIWKANQSALSEKSVEELCDAMGFNDVSSFYKLQKRWLAK